MIRIFGELTLIFALCFSFVQALVPLWGHWRHNIYALAFARTSALGQFICVCTAYLLLMIAFAHNDFSIAYVALNSHPLLPLIYRLTAPWGAHEGSILLWIFILNLWTILFLIRYQGELRTLTLSILGLISFCFLCFLLLTSNPFTAALPNQAALDLNPLLQDPGFVSHPPMLYMGYVGFSVAFAITMAALIRGELNTAWASLVHQFTLAAWCFLTLGITLGSWWAYRVLGWGGFWFWDPVENASLLPWLCGTALLHVLILVQKHESAKAWAALLSIICFALSLLGTFLVRSGVLISAHTFANDPARGVFLLLLLALISTAAFLLYALRMPNISSKKTPFGFLSRQMSLLINSVLFFTAMLTVLMGTLYPLILDAFHLGTISVGAPYFNSVMLPIVLIAMVMMGLAPFLSTKSQTKKILWQQVRKKIIISLIVPLLLMGLFLQQINFTILVCLILSAWIIQSIIPSRRVLPGMSLAHLGFAILMMGILLSSVLKEEREVLIKPGDTVHLGPYQFLFLDAHIINGPNYFSMQAAFDVIKNKRHITNLYPEKRNYPVREMVMSKVDIHPGLFRDLYIALGEPYQHNFWSVRIYYKPFVRWIWFGGMIMMLGGGLAILHRKTKDCCTK